MLVFNPRQLQLFCQQVFEKLGVPTESALIAADALIRADLEGVDSHGISRLAIYARRLKEGRINPQPNIKLEKKGDSVLTVDGDNGLGQIVATKAVQEGIVHAKRSGVTALSIRRSNHFGTASYYCQLACAQGMGLIGMTTSPPGLPPWGGKKAYLGTNPISFGFPTGTDIPVIVDMSTSVVARGKIMLAAKAGQPIPKGWALDAEGRETESAEDALQGALLPLGGVKGYALSLAIEIMTGVLSGAAFGEHVQNLYVEHQARANVGHFFILLDIEKFLPLNQFTMLIQQLLVELKEIPLAEGHSEILYPGERRVREYKTRLENGIPLATEVWAELLDLGREVGISLPNPMVEYGK